ncbi:MAG: NAD(P)/FAD-dependent oxidoreductase [Candidatus Bathyarchaeota archaeon]|nr:MAG: NAD(P)/FAD-dependent oxidoreductase [Candidatus Bathyarchaeota archaeon]
MDYDATLIGAGPTGSLLAEMLANEGYDVLMLEEHSEIGVPQHCTGKISATALKELDLKPAGVLQKIRGATFYSPNAESFKVEKNSTVAYVLDRRIFDKYLSEKAVKAGAVLIQNARAAGVSISSSCTKVNFICRSKSQNVTSRIVIGSDGARSSVARWLGLYSKNHYEMKLGVQKEVVGIEDIEPDIVELYFGRNYAPGFFAWIVPMGKERAKIGLCVDIRLARFAFNYLDKFCKNHPIASIKLRQSISNKINAHIIPTGGSLKKTISDGVLVVGDAAGQVKSTTGGGLYYGMLCSRIAGKILSMALKTSKKGIIRKETLIEYEKLWRKKLEKEIVFSVKARAFMDSLTDEETDYLLKILREDEPSMNIIEAKGNIDWQSSLLSPIVTPLISKVAKKPKILFKLGKNLIMQGRKK